MFQRHQIENLVPFLFSLFSILLFKRYFMSNFIFLLSVLITLSGLILWWAGKITIHDNWFDCLSKPKLKKLVTHGIYSKIRHPIYIGLSLTIFGWALLIDSLIFWIFVIFIITFLIYRMQKENKFLEKKLGKKYRKYKNKTII